MAEVLAGHNVPESRRRNGASRDDKKDPRKSFWACSLLGVVLIVAGVVVLRDIAFATRVGVMAIGIAAAGGGAFEVAHAFWTKGWGAVTLRVLLGVLYIAFGVTMLRQPAISAIVLTYALGLALLASGIVRIVLGVRFRRTAGTLLWISGVLGVLAGLIILTGWPISGLWAIGLLFGVDLIAHGVGWLVFARRQTHKPGLIARSYLLRV